METAISEIKLKKIVEGGSWRGLVENKELFPDLIFDAVEDIALIKAIKEGENSQAVDREEIFKILNVQKWSQPNRNLLSCLSVFCTLMSRF